MSSIMKMNNIIKTGLFTSLVFAIGFFGISTLLNVDDVFAEKEKQSGMNTPEEITPINTLKNGSEEKCGYWDPRC